MSPYYTDDLVELYHGDCLDVLRAMPDESVSAVICDPPYGLSDVKPAAVTAALVAWANGDRERVPDAKGFMGRSWDAFVPPPAVWDECLRVLKPGGHLLAFAGSRTADLMGLSVRLAGFEIRDTVTWLYGSGFPKSLDVSKAVDKLDAAAERRARALEFTAWIRSTGLTAQRIDAVTGTNMGGHYTTAASQPAVATADLFDLLRPLLPEVPDRIEQLVAQRTVESQNSKAREVIGERTTGIGTGRGTTAFIGDSDNRTVTAAYTDAARRWSGWGTALKPASEPIIVARKPLAGTVAATVLAHGTGALNIDGCRVAATDKAKFPAGIVSKTENVFGGGQGMHADRPRGADSNPDGRWPANVVFTHAPCCGPDEAPGECVDGCPVAELDAQSGTSKSARSVRVRAGGDVGDGETLHSFKIHADNVGGFGDSGGASRFFPTFRYQAKAPTRERPKVNGIAHPTTKPLTLMRWLAKLVTPPGGTILEPFAGSGTTIEAAMLEGFHVVGVEREADYLPLIAQRIARAHGVLREQAEAAETVEPTLFDAA